MNWQPAVPFSEDAMMAFYSDAESQGILQNLFKHNMKQGTCDVTLFEGQMLKSLSGMASDSFDLVFIHGTRVLTQFAEVYAECRRLLAEKGLLCGTGLMQQQKDVHEYACNHGNAHRHNCFTLYDETSSKRYYPEITSFMANEHGAPVTADGFWTTASLSLPQEPKIDEATLPGNLYEIFPYQGKFAVLHRSVGRSRIGSERLGERPIPGLLEWAETETAARERAEVLTETELRRKGTVVEETKHYYICKYGQNTYLAQCKMNDFPSNFKIFSDRVGDYEMAPTLLKGKSLAGLKQKVAVHEATFDAKTGWHPIQERFNGYFLYATHDEHCVAAKLDLVHGQPFSSMIGQEDLPPYVLTAPSMDILKRRIEQQREQEMTTGGILNEPDEWL